MVFLSASVSNLFSRTKWIPQRFVGVKYKSTNRQVTGRGKPIQPVQHFQSQGDGVGDGRLSGWSVQNTFFCQCLCMIPTNLASKQASLENKNTVISWIVSRRPFAREVLWQVVQPTHVRSSRSTGGVCLLACGKVRQHEWRGGRWQKVRVGRKLTGVAHPPYFTNYILCTVTSYH